MGGGAHGCWDQLLRGNGALPALPMPRRPTLRRPPAPLAAVGVTYGSHVTLAATWSAPAPETRHWAVPRCDHGLTRRT